MAAPSITLTYTKSSTEPPLYIACSWTDPPWQGLEMDISSRKSPNGDTIFFKEFPLMEHGRHHYKYIVGDGNRWVVDELAPSDTDEHGFTNNVLFISDTLGEFEKSCIETKHTKLTTKTEDSLESNPDDRSHKAPSRENSDSDEPAPLFRHETVAPEQALEVGAQESPAPKELDESDSKPSNIIASGEQSPEIPATIPELEVTPDSASDEEDDEPVPLFRHETIPADKASEIRKHFDNDEPVPLFRHESITAEDVSQARRNFLENEEADDEAAPLFRHETIPLNEPISDTTPLFRHESIYSHIDESPFSRTNSDAALTEDFNHEYDAESRRADHARPAMPHEASGEGPARSSTSLNSIAEDADGEEEEEADDDDRSRVLDESPVRSPTDMTSALRASPSKAEDRPATPNSFLATTPKRKESLMTAFWRVCFGSWIGPVGSWLAGLFGSRRNATVSMGTIAAISVAVVAMVYLPD